MSTIFPFYSKENIEEEARVWLIRLDGDTPLSAAEQNELKEWCQRSPEHQQELLRISEIFEEANVLVELAIPLKARKQSIVEKCRPDNLLANLRALLPKAGYAGISFLVLIVFAGVLLFTQKEMEPQFTSNGLYTTSIGEIRQELLIDGSTLNLNTSSEVSVDFNANTRRLVLTKGEAHFTVAKNKNWPFEVYVGEKIVKAVGTAFTIRLADKSMQVTVTEGKVDLINEATSPLPEPGASQTKSLAKTLASLEKGQRAIFETPPIEEPTRPHEEKFLITTVSHQQLEKGSAWQTGYLLFAGDPLSEVVEEISRYTDLEIEIASPELRDMRIGGRFRVNDLDALFEVLESNMGVQVAKLDNSIVRFSSATAQ